jgi:hypothetical protein
LRGLATNIICSSGDLLHEAAWQLSITNSANVRFPGRERTVAANPRASVTSFECGRRRR